MSVSLAGTRMTIEEALALPDATRYEMNDGVLIDRFEPSQPEMNVDHIWAAGEIFAALREYAKLSGGRAFPGGLPLSIWADQSKVRRPDACYFAPGRLAGDKVPKTGSIVVAPDVVLLSISPGDLAYDIDEALVEYLHAGVEAVWIASPNIPQVTIFSGWEGRVFRFGDIITGRAELPGFSCDVSTLFLPVE